MKIQPTSRLGNFPHLFVDFDCCFITSDDDILSVGYIQLIRCQCLSPSWQEKPDDVMKANGRPRGQRDSPTRDDQIRDTSRLYAEITIRLSVEYI